MLAIIFSSEGRHFKNNFLSCFFGQILCNTNFSGAVGSTVVLQREGPGFEA